MRWIVLFSMFAIEGVVLFGWYCKVILIEHKSNHSLKYIVYLVFKGVKNRIKYSLFYDYTGNVKDNIKVFEAEEEKLKNIFIQCICGGLALLLVPIISMSLYMYSSSVFAGIFLASVGAIYISKELVQYTEAIISAISFFDNIGRQYDSYFVNSQDKYKKRAILLNKRFILRIIQITSISVLVIVFSRAISYCFENYVTIWISNVNQYVWLVFITIYLMSGMVKKICLNIKRMKEIICCDPILKKWKKDIIIMCDKMGIKDAK